MKLHVTDKILGTYFIIMIIIMVASLFTMILVPVELVQLISAATAAVSFLLAMLPIALDIETIN